MSFLTYEESPNQDVLFCLVVHTEDLQSSKQPFTSYRGDGNFLATKYYFIHTRIHSLKHPRMPGPNFFLFLKKTKMYRFLFMPNIKFQKDVLSIFLCTSSSHNSSIYRSFGSNSFSTTGPNSTCFRNNELPYISCCKVSKSSNLYDR